MRVAIAADHAGVKLKAQLVGFMQQSGHEVSDLGPDDTASVDYPDFGHQLAGVIASADADFGILVCGTGVGMSMAANRHTGVRAVCCTDELTARMARGHNNANVLCLGARVIGVGTAEALVEAFLSADFEGGRHARRVEKIEG